MRWLRASTMLALLLVPACGTSEPAVQEPSGDASAPDAPLPGAATAVVFDESGTVTLMPGEARTLSIGVEPPGAHALRFALLGASLDASLDADDMVTDTQGRASIVLTAPRSATTFLIRATADDGPFDEVAVSVSADGFATVLVRAQGYDGRRATPIWTASAVARTTCSALTGNPPADGPIAAQAPDGEAVRLEGLPVGPSVAITLHAGKSVSGCRDAKDLAAMEEREVAVTVADTPIDLEATDVAYRMGLGVDAEGLRTSIAEQGALFADAVLPPSKSTASTLLDAMQELAPDPADMAAARANGDWDQIVGARLDDGGVDLREELATWIDKGLQPLWAGELIDGTLRAQGAGPGHGLLTIGRIFGLESSSVGLAQETLVSLEGGAKDSVQIGGSVLWFPSTLVASAADVGASAMASPATGGSEALASGFGCDDLPDALEAMAPLPASCESDCMRSLCRSAVALLWADARDASAAQLDTAGLTFTVSAIAEVTPEATIASFDGAWAGTYTSQATAVPLKGTVVATSQP